MENCFGFINVLGNYIRLDKVSAVTVIDPSIGEDSYYFCINANGIISIHGTKPKLEAARNSLLTALSIQQVSSTPDIPSFTAPVLVPEDQL